MWNIPESGTMPLGVTDVKANTTHTNPTCDGVDSSAHKNETYSFSFS